MGEEMFKAIASQLRKPEGDPGTQVGKKMNEGNRLINEYVIDVVKPSAGDRILEIGMGNGYFVKDILKTEQVTYTGVDFSPTMIEEASKMNQGFINKGLASFQLGSAEKLSFADQSFNKAFTVNTTYFWEDVNQVLAEIKRVLGVGGRLVIGVRPKSVMQNYPFVKYGFRMYGREDLAILLAANGFEVISIIEKDEPDQEVNGNKVKVASLIFEGQVK